MATSRRELPSRSTTGEAFFTAVAIRLVARLRVSGHFASFDNGFQFVKLSLITINYDREKNSIYLAMKLQL